MRVFGDRAFEQLRDAWTEIDDRECGCQAISSGCRLLVSESVVVGVTDLDM